jgi:uncharacterized protein
MKIVVAGGSGLIGSALVERLLARGDDVRVLTRNASHVRAGKPLVWDGKSQGPWSSEVADADVVINLAGENIGDGRWTAERKRRLIDSRLDATRALVQAMKSSPQYRRTFVSTSATGFYGLRGDEMLDESASSGSGFLADLTKRWEEEARGADDIARVVILRFGVVISPQGGALGKMLLPFKLGAGGPIGNGRQWMSWVDIDDAVRAIEWAVERDAAKGVYNVTSPEPVRNGDFARTLGRVLKRPALLPAPAFALRLALGEMADEVLLGGQRVVPARLHSEGFSFSRPAVETSLRNALIH